MRGEGVACVRGEEGMGVGVEGGRSILWGLEEGDHIHGGEELEGNTHNQGQRVDLCRKEIINDHCYVACTSICTRTHTHSYVATMSSLFKIAMT